MAPAMPLTRFSHNFLKMGQKMGFGGGFLVFIRGGLE
jgi:hypothetical protein